MKMVIGQPSNQEINRDDRGRVRANSRANIITLESLNVALQ